MQRLRAKCVQSFLIPFFAFLAFAGIASAQVNLASPSAPVLVGANINIAGTGYPTGTISAASTSVTVTPSPGNGSPVSFAALALSGAGSARTLTIKLPASLTANQPYTAAVCVSGQTTSNVAFTSSPSGCATITVNPAGSISNISPGAGQTGTAVNVTINGLFTHFAQATSVLTISGTGVTPSNMAVTAGSTTQMTATFTVAANATPGVRAVTVTSGSEVATLAVGFVVTASPGLSFSVINPNFGAQGTSLNVDVQGVNTHFAQGTTTANFGNAVTVTSIVVNSATDMVVGLKIDPLAPAGGRMVTVVTGGEFAVASNGFTVTSSGASIVSATPTTPIPQGGNATLTLTGLGTHWVTSGTVVSFGGGINTGSITVNSSTSLTVNITVGPGVPAGTYGVTTTTNGEVATLGSAVTVSASTPLLSGVSPTTGAQGATLDVIVNGTFTSFTTGSISANFGSLITVNSITPSSPTKADINISISNVAAAGGRSVTLTSNGTLFGFSFTVTPNGATVTSVTPNSGLQQSSVALQVTGAGTHWVQGTTTASLGDNNITINKITVNSATTAEVDITLGAQAGLGLHGISMTTGGEVASEANAFTVLPFTPSLTLMPSSGMIGTTLTVNFNGSFTHFSNQTLANIDGQGVQIQNFTVTGPSTATAQFVISPTAPSSPAFLCNPNNRTVTLTTGNEIVTAPYCVTSTPAVLTSITPSHSPQNTNLSVTITGQFTHFTNSGANPTTVSFGPNITPSGLVINSATSLTVNIAIDAVAALGWRQAYVNTGTEQLSIGFHIDAPASATLVSILPNNGQQGQTIAGVTITGNLTNFSANTIAIVGAGITVSNLQILSPSVATATITISPTTPTGGRTVEMITGAEDVSGPLFTVNPGIAAITFTPNCSNANAIAAICSGTLATVQQGGIVPFNVTGSSTNFLQGETTMDFGPGISVTQLVVNSPTSITGQIAVSFTAPIGFRLATATTGGEVAPTSSDALNVIQTTSTSLNIDVTSAPQGTSHLTIKLNGQLTNWINGTTTATFGNNNGMTVNSVTVTSPTQATLDLTIQGTTYSGLYSLTVTTNHGGGTIEQESLINVFSVNPGAAIITSVVPGGTSAQGSTESIAITGQNTSWINGVTSAYFTTGGCIGSPNPGVNVATVLVSSVTTATLSIAIAPNAQTGLQTLCMATLGELVNFQNAFTLEPGTPTLNGVTPVSAEQGTTVSLNIIGQFTNWIQGVTTITFGEGITLTSPLTVTSATAATATIAVDPLADIGPRNVVLNTNGQIVQGTAFFNVIAGPAILSSINPSTGNQGTHILMQVVGENTHWAQGLSQVTINGAGFDITINGVQVQSPTVLVIDMNLSPTANLGVRTVYVSTGGENVTLQNGFLVTGGIPSISSLSPASAQQGSTALNVQIGGIFTKWDNTTQVSFGPNITFGTPQITVNSNTSITAIINIPNGAPLGLQTVTVQTGGQILTTQFNILSNAPPTPYISYENPSVALVGQTLAVNLSGQFTHWLPGTTNITFGTGITVNNFQVTGENTAVANITIIPTATLGTRTVTMTTGAEVETTGFTVTVGTPQITVLSPGSIIQGQTLLVDVVGQYTTFNGSTVFAFGGLNSQITVNSVQLFGPTAARVSISAGIQAPLGGLSVSATTGSELAYNYGAGFSVTPSQATIISVSPNTAPQGTSPVINVTGFATTWSNATQFSLGGIGITNVLVNSPTSATLTLSIAPLAGEGEYSISATTVGEFAFLNNAFVVTAGTPILNSATGATVQQGMNFSTGILGTLTTFNGTTVVNLGNGVNVTGVTVTSPTSLTVTGTADPLAYTGGRNVTVTTTVAGNPQTLVLFGAFDVTPGTAQITLVSPNTGNQGQTLNVAITGTNTHFTTGESVANFGQGISVNTLTINSFTSATANITVAANAFAQQNSVTITTLGETATAVNAFTVISTQAIIDFINPTFLSQGQSGTIALTGSFTNWVNGNTVASFGPGINVTATNVTASNAATANITVTGIAAPGTRTVQMTTNLLGGAQEVAIKANAFTVNAGSATIVSAIPTTPATVHQGDTDDTIVITGSNTHFSASSLVAFCNGITPVQTNLNTATQLTVIMNVANTTAIGACGVTVTTGGEVATGAALFNVVAGIPVVSSVTPVSAHQNDQNVNVFVTGLFTHFVQGTTTANFGTGITVNGTVAVNSQTSATVNITVSPTATVQSYNVTMTTGAENAVGTGLFSVVAGVPQLTTILPNTGAQNSTQSVVVNGLFTHFDSTTTVAFSGANVTAGTPVINGPTKLTVSVTVAPGAAATARTVSVSTPDVGTGENEALTGGFTVLPGTPTIISINPNVGVPNTPALQVTITGLFTNWVNGTTTATFGPLISVGGAAQGAYGPINVTSPTTAVATIAIDPTAIAGTSRDVTVNGPPSITVNNGFTVQSTTPTAPTVVSVSPQNGATNVPLNTSYTVVFSSPIDPTTVSNNSLFLVPTQFGCSFSNLIPVIQHVDASGRIVTLTPQGVLAVGQGYYLCLDVDGPPYLKDPSGNTVNSNDYSFTTGFTTSNTGPTFLSANIANGDTAVGTNVTPVLGFDTPINSATQLAGLTIFAGATPVAGTWSYNSSYTQAIFTPAGGFAASTAYTINATAALTDAVGNPLVNPTTISFTTAAGADTVGPTLVSATPVNGSVTGENPVFRLIFSKEMNPLTVTAPGQYYLVNQVANQVVMGTVVTASADRKTFTMTIPGLLNPATEYYWNTGALYDQAGHVIFIGSGNFTTGTGVDLTAPTVILVSPPNGATGIAVNAPVEIQLSKGIDPTSVTASAITLTPSVAGAISMSGATITFKPSTALATSQLYTVHASGFTDVDGNAVTPFSSSFTTSGSSTPDITSGTISMIPTSGAVNVPTNSVVVFTLSKPFNPASVNVQGNVRLLDNTGGSYIAGVLSFNPAFTSITFTPSTPLESGHQYCGFAGYPFTNYILDLAGNNFNYLYDQCFTASGGADTTPPTVISVMPTNNATGIGPNNPVTVTFSKSMNPNTLNKNVSLYIGTSLYTQNYNTSLDSTTVIFNAGNLPYSTTFTVVVGPAVADLAGNQLGTQLTSTFTTMAHPTVTVPTVTAMHPSAGATNVPVNAAITLFISEPLNTATVPGALEIAQNGVLITGTITYGSNNQVVVFTPTGSLLPGANIKVFFTSAATDMSGNPLSNYQTSFTVAPNLSATPASLISETPTCCISNVATTTVVDLQFSKPLNPATVNSGSFYILQLDANTVTGTITLLNNNTVARFTPSAPLAGTPGGNNTYYRVHWENTIKDTDGLNVNGSADNTYYFYVGAASDTTKPVVTMVAPTNSATGIGTNSTIRLTFSEPIDALTVYSSTLTVAAGTTQIPYNATFDSTNTVLTIVPQAALPASSTITTSLTSGISDTSGNTMIPVSFSFNTGATPDFTLPTVIASSVSNNQTNVPVTSVFTLTYSKPIDTRTEVAGNTVYIYDTSFGQIPVNLSFSPDGTQVTVQPQTTLAVNHQYYVQVCNVQDLDGNQMNSCPAFYFTTALTPATGGPQVIFTLPPSGMQVPTNFNPEIQFDRSVDLTSLGGITLQQGGNPVAFTTAGSAGGTVVGLTPNALLAPNDPFTLTISGVKDTGGNTMTGSVIRNFTTGATVDLTAPVVTAITPQSGEVTGTNPQIRITFNEPINPLASNGSWYLTNNVTNTRVAGSNIVASADLKSETITYPGALDPNTQYCWSEYYVYDLAGNQTYTGSQCFTTSTGVVNSGPTVTSVTPPNGQTGVPINTLVQILLSAPIDSTSVTASSLTLNPAAPATASVVLSSGQTITLNLGGSTLAANTVYTVNASGFRDLEGNTVTPFSSSFTTSSFNDTANGTISLTSPAPGSTGIPTNSAIQVTLSKAVDPNSVSQASMLVFGNNNGNQRIPGNVTIGNGGSTLTFTPTGTMPPSTPIAIYIGYPSGGGAYLYDLAGNNFNYLQNSNAFTTASTPDTTAPTVLSVTPTNGSTNSGPNTVVTLIFSKALNNATVNSTNFTLFNGFSNLNANVGISADNRTVTLSTTLPYSATISVAVNTSVQDLDGNGLANPFASTFTTEAQPLTATPTVTQMRPANGATGVLLNDTITLYFSAPLNASTVPGAFYVSQNGVLINGSVVVTSDLRSAVWTGPGFQNSAYIQVYFTGATDTSGNAVNYYAASFTAAPNTTTTPATLVSQVPQCCISNVAQNTYVELQFSKPINPATVNASSFYILKLDATPAVTGTITMLSNNTVLRFTPSAPLAGAAGNSIYYRVHWENSIQDTTGLPISGSADNTSYFYVGTSSNNTTPTVTSVAPYNGATGVGDNATVRFSFSEAMDNLTINPSTVSLMNGATSIPFSLSFSGLTATLSPYAPLPVNATLTLALTSGISDTSGNAIAAQSDNFQTGSGEDFSAPYVIYSSVNSNTPAVPVNSTFTLIFNKPLDRSTPANTCGYYYLYDNNTGCVPVTITVSPDGRTVTFVPTTTLAPSQGYSLNANYAADLDGNAQANFGVGFTTSAGADTTPPAVLTVTPANGASGAPLNAAIEVQFNEAVNNTTLGQITLMNGATPVPFTGSLIYADSTVLLTPGNLLAPNTTYSVAVSGVQDVAGNAMTGTYNFSFTTGTNVDNSPTPNVISTVANGLPLSYNVDVAAVPDNPTITITLDTPVEPASLSAGAILLYLNSNQNITYPLNIALSPDQKTITVTLAPGTLAAGTEYQFRVGYNFRIRDWAGNNNGGQYYLYYFTTQ